MLFPLVEEIIDAERITSEVEQLLTLDGVVPVPVAARLPAVAQVAATARLQLRCDRRVHHGTGAFLRVFEQQRPHPRDVVGAGMLEQVRVDDARVQRVGQYRHALLLEHQVRVLGEQDLGELALVVRVRGVVVFTARKEE